MRFESAASAASTKPLPSRNGNIRKTISATLFAAACAFALAPAPAAAEWPDGKPITIVMPFPAGSGVDVTARQIQAPLEKLLATKVLIEYKAGAAGNIASAFVARAQPDGHTLLLGTSGTHGINAALYKKLPFDVEADFTPVAPLIDVSNVLTINPSVIDVKTVEAFIAEVKANPDKYNFASTGNGTGTHLAFADFNARAGLKMVHVPYKGGPDAMLGVLQGDVCCIMNQVQTVLAQWRAGKVRLLGLTTPKRVDVVADVPTIAESALPGFSNYIWFGLIGPKGMDPKVVTRINDAVRQVLESPDLKQTLVATGNTVRIESPQAFKETVHADRARWGELVRSIGVSIE